VTLDTPITVTIEQANWRDFNTVNRLEKICFPVDVWPFWEVFGVLSLPQVVRLKALVERQLVGFIALDIRPRENVAWIATIGVLPEYRRRGVASRLISAAETQVTVESVRLSLRSSNEGALRLYQRLGYEHFDRWPRYYVGGEDAIVMQKIINR
jgi:ribosomal-protein-alanine N-acetyltransferase